MAKSKLASAYKAAAAASSKHQASLYDVANIGYQRESSAQLAGIKAQDMSRTVGMISEGLELGGRVIRRGQEMKKEKTAAEALGAVAKPRSLWGKLTGEEQMYEIGGAEVSGADVTNKYRLTQLEKAGFSDIEGLTSTKKDATTPSKKPASVPEVKEEKKEPTLAEETNLVGPPAPKQGLNITGEQLEDWKSTSGFYDESSGKTALTQMANWQKSGKPKRDIATLGPKEDEYEGPRIVNY